MPKVNDAMRSAAQEPGTENDVGTILQNRFKKDRVFIRVILQVGVLNDHYVSCRVLETSAQSCAFPKIAFLQYDFIHPSGRFPFEKFSCPISRTIVHNDNFHV